MHGQVCRICPGKGDRIQGGGPALVPIPHPITGRRPEEVDTLVRDSFIGVVKALTSTPEWETEDEAGSTASSPDGDIEGDCN